ncbi:hypothetical protein H920_02583 [Fukomys damarensis]|uniref:Uncharacterized protein n=1 Tax=Fukomys damarensis TaxID=885580 RepID=A0A091E0A5_FUKDA|nr:hypothetical protein H920_02583 [Fukomys damarensis]
MLLTKNTASPPKPDPLWAETLPRRHGRHPRPHPSSSVGLCGPRQGQTVGTEEMQRPGDPERRRALEGGSRVRTRSPLGLTAAAGGGPDASQCPAEAPEGPSSDPRRLRQPRTPHACQPPLRSGT